MRSWVRLWILFFGLFSVLVLAGDDPEVRVNTSRRGGTPLPGGRDRVHYHASAFKTGSTTSKFQLVFKNTLDHDISFIVCFMFNLRRAEQDHNLVYITKETILIEREVLLGGIHDITEDRWVCNDAFDGLYLSQPDNAPPSMHFGCQRVALAAKGSMEQFNGRTVRTDEWTFRQEIDWGMEISDDDLGKVYIDFLVDCPIDAACDFLKTPGAPGSTSMPYLVPDVEEGSTQSTSLVNTWGGGDYMRTLRASGQTTSTTSWAATNWLAMADPQRRPVPATLDGTIEGAPADSEIRFAFGGQPGGTYTVPPDPSNAPCGGMPVNIREDYMIPPNNEAEDSFSIRLNSPCEDPPEGTMVRLSADVLARPGAPFHSSGELQHYVDTVMVVDNTAPQFLEGPTYSMISSDSVQFDTVIRDDLTDAVGATLCCSVDGGPLSEIPMSEVPPVQSGEAIGFSASYQRASPSESNLNCHVRAADEFGNNRESSPLSVSLQPLQVSTPWILTSGVFSGAQLFSTGDGTVPEQIRDANNEVTGASGNIAGPDACSWFTSTGLSMNWGTPIPLSVGGDVPGKPPRRQRCYWTSLKRFTITSPHSPTPGWRIRPQALNRC